MKSVFAIIAILGLVFSNGLAVKPDNAYKQKSLPKGLQKKVARGGELPPGWQRKIAEGQVVDSDILNRAKVVRVGEYPYPEYKTEGSEIYKIQDKIFKVIKATNIIVDVLEN